jgi:hypothetical protein
MIGLLFIAVVTSAHAEANEDALKPQVEIVMRCYTDRMKDNLKVRATPKQYEDDIQKTCGADEVVLKALAKASLPDQLNRDDRFVMKVRERAVIRYFNILQRLDPKFKDQCPLKDYACIINVK